LRRKEGKKKSIEKKGRKEKKYLKEKGREVKKE
jgi:hypothetical protein